MGRFAHKGEASDTVGNVRPALPCATAFIFIVVVTFLCFLPDLENELLIWDDLTSIVNNDAIKSLSPELFRWAFFDFYITTWFPLTWISLAIDYAFWGVNPVGYHLTNNILHALNAGMVFLLINELLLSYRQEYPETSSDHPVLTNARCYYGAALAALFFAVHPLRVESVAWASERKDVLSLFFGLPALLAYLKHTRVAASQATGLQREVTFVTSPYYWAAFILFCLSLVSKPTLVTLPLILLILDRFPLNRYCRVPTVSILLEKVPLFVAAGIVSLITSAAQQPLIAANAHLLLSTRVLNAVNSLVAYLWLTLWPVNLSTFYLHPGNITTVGPEYLLSIVVFAVVTICCLLSVRRYPIFLVSWLVYLITLLPVLGLIQTGAQAMAARYTYVPGVALSLLFALGVTALAVRCYESRIGLATVVVAVCTLLLWNGYHTLRQISYWKDDVTLWTRAIELQPHTVGRAYFQRGGGYAAKGELHKALADMNEAAAIASAKQYRDMHTIYIERARIYARLGNLDAAIADYGRCLLTDTSPMRSMYYAERGRLYQQQGKMSLADDDFKLAGTAVQSNKQ